MNAHSRIVSDPGICGGRPRVSGTRVRVSDVLDMLAGGARLDEILVDYPYLKAEDIQACLAYASHALNHSVVFAAE